MMYPRRNIKARNLKEGYQVSKSGAHIQITREPTEADKKYIEDYNNRYHMKYRGGERPVAISAYYNTIPGCCSGLMISRLNFGRTLGNAKSPSLAQRTELLKMLMQQFKTHAILMYLARSDNSQLPETFHKAGWKKSRGPVGKYTPYNYTLDVYTVDPRIPKKKLPSLKLTKKKKVGLVAMEERPVALTGRYRYIGNSIETIKRRINGLRG